MTINPPRPRTPAHRAAHLGRPRRDDPFGQRPCRGRSHLDSVEAHEFQHPEVGQRIGEEGFVIRALEPNRLLLLSYHYATTEWVRKQGLWPRFGSCSWAFVLRPLPGGRTRLLTRTRYRVDRLDLSALAWPFFLAADLVVQPKMLNGIKRRVESASSRS